MRNAYTERLKEKLKEALQAVLPIMGLVLVLCFSVAPISPSILLCFLLGGGMEHAEQFLGFSLPVTATAGMRLTEEEPEQN